MCDLRGELLATRLCMDPNMTSVASLATVPTPDRVSDLAARSLSRESDAAFQSLLAATHDALGRVIGAVREAEASALCLAQQEHARTVAEDLVATREALHTGMSDGAQCLRYRVPSLSAALRGLLRPDRQRLADAARAVREAARTLRPEVSVGAGWFFTTAHAVEALGDTATHVESLAEAQPGGSAAREIGSDVVAVLRLSRDTLLGDIARLAD